MLTPEETKWIKKLQKVMNECPSDRLGFYTTGDTTVSVYDSSDEASFDESVDFPMAVDKADAYLGSVDFPANVIATVG